MIKIHYFNSSNKTVQHDFNMKDLQLPIHNEDLLWVDLYAYSYNELNNIADVFGFHPLAVEDCLHEGSRPKMDNYGDYKFFVFHAPIYNEKVIMKLQPLSSIFLWVQTMLSLYTNGNCNG